jgi:hypothetical protein
MTSGSLSAFLLLSLLLRAPAARAAMAPFRGADAADGFVLKLFPAGTSALCLDGSVAGYYVRPGRGAGASTFLLEQEGGGESRRDESRSLSVAHHINPHMNPSCRHNPARRTN